MSNYARHRLTIAIFVCLAVLMSLYATAGGGRLLNKFIRSSIPGRMATLKGSRIVPPPAVKSIPPLQGVVRSCPDVGKVVALTFDDGPSRKFTPLYLKILNRYGVHATFFLIGRHVRENSGLAAMIVKNGNELGCHTFNHRNLEQMDPNAAKQDIESAKQLIEQDSQRQVGLFRPPGGHLDQSLLKMINGMGLKVVLWSIDPEDWYASPEKIIANVLTNLQPGSIILLHEDRASTLAALPTLIGTIKQRGYQLVTVSELLAIQGTQEIVAK